MEFKLTPVKEKPKKNDGGWLIQRTKKPDKWDFEGNLKISELKDFHRPKIK